MKAKKLLLVALLAATPVWAAEQRFPISLTGSIQTSSTKLKITEQDLLLAPGNQLVLMIDTTSNIVAIEEWNSTLTVQIDRVSSLTGVQGLMENFRMAMVMAKRPMLMANLEMVDFDWDRDGSNDYDGNLQLIAKLGVDPLTGLFNKVSAQLVGVLNDPVNGIGLGEAKLFKGRIKSIGASF